MFSTSPHVCCTCLTSAMLVEHVQHIKAISQPHIATWQTNTSADGPDKEPFVNKVDLPFCSLDTIAKIPTYSWKNPAAVNEMKLTAWKASLVSFVQRNTAGSEALHGHKSTTHRLLVVLLQMYHHLKLFPCKVIRTAFSQMHLCMHKCTHTHPVQGMARTFTLSTTTLPRPLIKQLLTLCTHSHAW